MGLLSTLKLKCRIHNLASKPCFRFLRSALLPHTRPMATWDRSLKVAPLRKGFLVPRSTYHILLLHRTYQVYNFTLNCLVVRMLSLLLLKALITTAISLMIYLMFTLPPTTTHSNTRSWSLTRILPGFAITIEIKGQQTAWQVIDVQQISNEMTHWLPNASLKVYCEM